MRERDNAMERESEWEKEERARQKERVKPALERDQGHITNSRGDERRGENTRDIHYQRERAVEKVKKRGRERERARKREVC